MLGTQLTYEDIEAVDPAYHKTLVRRGGGGEVGRGGAGRQRKGEGGAGVAGWVGFGGNERRSPPLRPTSDALHVATPPQPLNPNQI